MRKIVLLTALILMMFTATRSWAENLTYAISNKLIYVSLIGDLNQKEAELFDDKIVTIAKHLPQESYIYIDRGDGFWTYIEISEEHELLGSGMSDYGTTYSYKQFSSALKRAVKDFMYEHE